jgi:hypothetical protein
VTIDKISGKKLILRYVNAIPAAVGKVFETTLLAQAVLRGNSGSTTPPRNTWSSCNAAANSPTSRPRGCRAAEQRYELASFHSITSSARASTVSGISRSSAFAVLS